VGHSNRPSIYSVLCIYGSVVSSGGSSPRHLGRGTAPCEHGSASLYRGSGGRALSGVQEQSPWSGV